MPPESRNSPLLDNGSVNTFPRQLIGGVTDELFEMVIYIRLASKLQKESSVQFTREFNHSAFVGEFSVQLWSVNQRTTKAEQLTDS
jgi:hypothetical protein